MRETNEMATCFEVDYNRLKRTVFKINYKINISTDVSSDHSIKRAVIKYFLHLVVHGYICNLKYHCL